MVLIKNSTQRYGIIAIVLHWLIALLMIALFCLGLYMVDLPISVEKLRFYGWHKQFGMLVLALAIIRVIWRWSNVLPVLDHIPQWQRWAAHSMHWAFYGFMFFLPLSGWLMSSAAGLPVSFFGWFLLPNLVSANPQLYKILIELHEYLAYGLMIALCGHIGASFWHHFFEKDDILRRMLP